MSASHLNRTSLLQHKHFVGMGFRFGIDADKIDAAANGIVSAVSTIPFNGIDARIIWFSAHFTNNLTLDIVDEDICFRFGRQSERNIGIRIEGIGVV